jgi:hypothetical protein
MNFELHEHFHLIQFYKKKFLEYKEFMNEPARCTLKMIRMIIFTFVFYIFIINDLSIKKIILKNKSFFITYWHTGQICGDDFEWHSRHKALQTSLLYFIKRNKPQTFHYSSKNQFHVMVYGIIDTENNQHENIFVVLESLDQQLVVLKITENNKKKASDRITYYIPHNMVHITFENLVHNIFVLHALKYK